MSGRAQFPEVVAEREALMVQVAARRRAGISYEKIHAELGVLPQTAHAWMRKAMREATARRIAEVELLRTEQVARLEDLLSAVWPAAMEGSPLHVAEARRLVLAIADITGARAPMQVSWGLSDVQRAIDAVDRALAERTARIEKQPHVIEGEAGPVQAPDAG